MPKQDILVFGATGRTGGVIMNSLLDSPDKFNVFAAIRPASSEKPIVKEFKEKGAKIILIDIASPKEELLAAVTGKDVVISAVVFSEIDRQYALADVAKEAGVKRFVPCDFGTVCARGVRRLYDQKLQIHDHIEKIGLGHTYIDVGWWFQLNFPLRNPSPLAAEYPIVFESSRWEYEGDKQSLLTNMYDIGPFVARIIDDPRTLNHYVVIWGEEVTQQQIFSLYHKYTGEKLETTLLTEADVRALVSKKESSMDTILVEYMHSLWIRGDNTLENAKKPEYGAALDARELYPDVVVHTLEGYAKEVLA